jgi:hypothetical protein
LDLSLSDIKEKYADLIDQKISRKFADRWAYFIIKKNESREVTFIPSKDEKKIWEEVMYLYGIDLEEAPGEYLHSFEEIEHRFNERFKSEDDLF